MATASKPRPSQGYPWERRESRVIKVIPVGGTSYGRYRLAARLAENKYEAELVERRDA
jgi:hypothetical protein